jgi:FkbM family methyltransferase
MASKLIRFLERMSTKGFTPPVKRLIVRLVASSNIPRTLLNWYYNLLDASGRFRFWERYAKIFRKQHRWGLLSPGEWIVNFAGHRIRSPLRSSWSWLDWDTAVSIVGFDIDIKQTYLALIQSSDRPNLFLDVGANYGTHSVLFLSAGIPAIAFEPNPSCFSHFQAICKLNDLSGRWEEVAIGKESGEIELVYPERNTWLGAVASDVVSNLKKFDDLKTVRVPIKTLDYYSSEIPRGKALIKIDVEGHEVEVLKGGTHVLRDCIPKIIFESNDAQKRDDLFQILESFGYALWALPWFPGDSSNALCLEEFRSAKETNFLAIPNKRPSQATRF